MEDWEAFFSPGVLRRGFDYFQDGRVNITEINRECIRAYATGTEIYEVEIDRRGGQVTDMSCSCPHAESGEYCKHMAAVLFETERAAERVKAAFPAAEDNVDISTLVNNTDPAVLRNFVVNVLQKDPSLPHQLKLMTTEEMSASDVNSYKDHISHIVERYTDYDFIDYYDAAEMFNDLEEFFDNEIDLMMSKEAYQAVFDITCRLLKELNSIDIDDSGGGYVMILEDITALWAELLDKGSRALEDTMYQWMKDSRWSASAGEIGVMIDDFLFNHFQRPHQLEMKLEQAERTLNEIKERDTDSWSLSYKLGPWAVRCIHLKHALNHSENQVQQFINQYLDLHAVREYYVNVLIEKGDVYQAIEVLKTGKEKEVNYPGVLYRYSIQLKDLYRQVNDQSAYENELWTIISGRSGNNIEIFKEIKALYSQEEWQHKREVLFDCLPLYSNIDQYFLYEGMYDRLLEAVLQKPGLKLLKQYEDVLLSLYPVELLLKYEQELEREAAEVSNREHYRTLVYHLRDMKKYPQGIEKVEEIVERWKAAYKRRRAMMDELSKI